MEQGPQRLDVFGATPDGQQAALDPELAASITSLPGVLSVQERMSVELTSCRDTSMQGRCDSIFVGTCDQLTSAMTVTGCRDDQAAWINSINVGEWADYFVEQPELTGELTVSERSDEGATAAPEFTFELGAPLTHDVTATADRLGSPPSVEIFVPTSIAREWGIPVYSLAVVAEVGVGADVMRVARAAGADAMFPASWEYQRVMTTRVTTWILLTLAIVIALLTFALASVDQAKATRRGRARLVAIGVPAPLLRRSQLTANLLPLGSAVVLAVGLGLLGAVTFADSAELPLAIEPRVLGAMLGLVLVGSLLVSAATLPLTRTRLRAEDLREE